ncbi:MAG: Fe-S protein assembly co-chaperone HscB [Chitinophagaceae bacterium]|jgi:molecular chaperone HscB|nr:Fe-S protein assembly co-chaperone HscB [Chitinophagaceae bacterium]
MTHFELYDLPVSLKIDATQLKQKFYALSRKYHPDFFTASSEAEQAEALQLSAQVNKAFKILSDADETIKYVLQLKNLLDEEEKYALAPDFLMEMMELSEQAMEAKMDDDTTTISNIKLQISNLQLTIYEPVKHIVETYQEGSTTEKELLQVKEYYYQKKYLNRILAGLV